MIYIASPYTDPDPEIMQRRYEAVLRYCVHLVQEHEVPYSPIIHFHEMAKYFDLPKDFIYWRKVNATMLRVSSCLHALLLPGAKESEGLDQELDDADIMHLPIHHVPGALWWDAAEMPL